MKLASHAPARPDVIDTYERAHRNVRTELTDAIRSARALAWTIWSGGVDRCHVIESDDDGGCL